MQDNFKPYGSTASGEVGAGKGNYRTVPVIGVVKDNIDPIRSGRLQVFVADIGGSDPDNADSWITVNYLTPFYGYVEPTSNNTGPGDFVGNPASYGMWFSPPDIGTEVLCVFVNGDPNYGFWVGCIPKPEALRMVPAIGANFPNENVVPNKGEGKSLGGAERLPVTNMNTNDANQEDSPLFLTAPKPVHSYVASIMAQQGIIRDPIRGPISSSSQRESPSRVGWGVSTPGRPIYEGGYTDDTILSSLEESNQETLKVISRRGGHSIVMDDGDIVGQDQLIRIRTALGHQILLSDSGQVLSILHSNGQSYIELGKEGTIDMYSTNSVNIRTQGDLNLHADNNVNIHAKKKLQIFAEESTVNIEKDLSVKTGKDFQAYTMGKFTHLVDGAYSIKCTGEASLNSSSITYINGSKVNLNTGETSVTPEKVKDLPIVAHSDTLFDSEKGYAAAPVKLQSITSRAPAHYPWSSANQGVAVETSTNASENLPANPSSSADAVNNLADNAANEAEVSAAGISTVPPVEAVSPSIDKATTTGLVSAAATSAATGPLKDAVAKGADIVKTATGNIAAVGPLALNPKQLETAGFIKPGSSATVNALIQSGANITQSMSNAIFTGKDGVKSVVDMATNLPAQVGAAVRNLQQVQSGLQATGIMSGKEAPTAVAGMVLSGFNNGITNTVNTIKNVATTALGGVTSLASNTINSLTGSASKVLGTINAGNFAAGAMNNVSGALSAVQGSLSALPKITGVSGLIDAAKGVSASAFTAITDSFKPLQPGVPQNLIQIAKANAEKIAANATNELQNVAGQFSNLTGGLSSTAGLPTSLATNLLPQAGQLLQTGSRSIQNLNSQIPDILKTTGINPSIQGLSPVSSIASGISALPGGQAVLNNITNFANPSNLSVPGVDIIKNASQSVMTAATNGLSIQDINKSFGTVTNLLPQTSKLLEGLGTNPLSSLAGSGLPSGAAAQLNAAVSSLSSGSEIQIKLPEIGLNTLNRKEITTNVQRVLENPKIPAPDWLKVQNVEADAILKNEFQKQLEEDEKRKEKSKNYDEQFLITKKAKEEFSNALNILDEGDAQIPILKTKYIEEYKKLIEIIKS